MTKNTYDGKTITTKQTFELLKARESFVIETIKHNEMPIIIEFLESRIKSLGMRSRTFTERRKLLMAGMAIPTPVTAVAGAVSAIGIGAHNLATWNPDYEIAKNKAKSSLTVTY